MNYFNGNDFTLKNFDFVIFNIEFCEGNSMPHMRRSAEHAKVKCL